MTRSKEGAAKAVAHAEVAAAEVERLSLDLKEEQARRQIAEARARDAREGMDAIRASWASQLIAPMLMLGERKRQRRKERRQKREIAFITAANLIDPNWYVSQYPDVAASGMDPVFHYVAYGAYEGRNPNPGFNSNAYLDENPDVARLGVNPLYHYERYGRAEGRAADARRRRLSTAEAYALWQARYDYDPSKDRQHLQDHLAALQHRPKFRF